MKSEVIAQEFGEELWAVEGDPLRMLGIPFRTRMAVARLPGGGLWMWSPVAATEERVEAIRRLGPLLHVVAPNKLHHLHVGPWLERFPEARCYAGPGLKEKRPDLAFTAELGMEAEPAWEGVIDQTLFVGSSFLTEPLFLHRPSRTLLVTDILQSHEPEADGWFWRTVKKVNGILAPEVGVPRDWRLTVRDKEAARASLERLLLWDFDRLLITHGRCLKSGAHAKVEEAFAWLE